jgi:hypothetical protein
VRRALLAFALFATPVFAQAPASAPDSARRIFTEVFIGQPAPPAFVTLADGLVYRLEIEPATAQITIRVARSSSLPPLFLTPLSDASGAAHGASYLLVPRASAEYRLDVTTDGDEPVRVRIELDPRENARWARMREETRNQRPAGLAIRAVVLGPFPDYQRNNVGQTLPVRTAGTGLEVCFAVQPFGTWFRGPVGGCVLSLTHVWREGRANLVFLGTNPSIQLSAADAPIEVALGLVAALGSSTTSNDVHGTMTFYQVGLDVQLATRLGGGASPASLALSGGVSRIWLGKGNLPFGWAGVDPPASIVPRLAAGLRYAL